MSIRFAPSIVRSAAVAGIGLAGLGLGACGSSSSGSATTTSMAPSTTSAESAVARLVRVCHRSARALDEVGAQLKDSTAGTPMSQIDNVIRLASAPIQACQSATQSAIPGLPTGAQSAATAYGQGFTALVQLTENPPTSQAATSTWVQQFTAAAATLGQARTTLIQADPAFANL